MKYRALFFLPTVLILSIIIILGLSVRDRIYDRLSASYVEFFENAEEQFGVTVKYRSITSHSLSTLHFDDIVLSWYGSTVSIPRLSVRANPFYFRVQKPLGFLRSIHANKFYAKIDVETINVLQERIASATESPAGRRAQILPLLDDVKLISRNSTILLHNKSSQYAMEQVDISIVFSDTTLNYSGDILFGLYENVDVDSPFFMQDGNVRMRVELDGAYSAQEISSNTAIRLSDINLGGVAIHPLSLNVYSRQNQWSLENADKLRDLHLASLFSADDGLFHFDMVSNGIGYEQIVIEQESAITIPRQLRGEYAFNLSVTYDVLDRAIEYTLQFRFSQQESVALVIDASGDNQQIFINESTVYSSLGTTSFVGAFNINRRTMDGTLSLDQLAIGNYQSMSGVFYISDIDRGLTNIVASDFVIGQSTIPKITADVQLAPSVNTISLSIIFDSQQTEIASLTISNNRNISATDIVFSLLQVNVHQLSKLASDILLRDGLAIPDVFAHLHADTRVEVAIADDKIDISIPFFNIIDQSTQEEKFAFRAIGNRDFFRVDSLSMVAFDQQISGFATVHKIAEQTYDFDLSMNSIAQEYSLNARYRQNQFLRFSGTHGLSGALLFLPQNKFRYHAQLTSLPLKIARTDFILGFNARGDFQSGDNWQVSIPTISMLETEASSARKESLLNRRVAPYYLVGGISATPQRLVIDRLGFRDHVSSFEGSGELILQPNGVDLSFEARSDKLAERLSLDGYVPIGQNEDLLMTAVIEQLDIRHLPQNVLRGAINSTISIARDDAGIIGNIELSSQDVIIGNLPIAFSGAGIFRNTAILMENVDVYCYGYHMQNGSFGYDITSGRITTAIDIVQEERLSIIPASPSIIVDSPYPFVESRIVASVEMGSAPITLTRRLQVADVQLISMDTFNTKSLSLRINRDDAQNRYIIAGDDGSGGELVGYVSHDGNLQLATTGDFPISFAARGSITDGFMDVLISDIFIDVQNIPRLLDLGFLRMTYGQLDGAVRIVGDVGSLQFYGKIKSNQLGLLTTYIPTEIGPVNTFLILRGNELQLVKAYVRTGEQGGAYFDANFRLVKGVLLDFSIYIHTPEGIVVPFEYDFGVVQIAFDVSGSVVLNGSPGVLNISGEIRGESGSLIARNMRHAIPRSELAPKLFLDLALSSGPQFELLWPSVEFPILRAFPELGSGVRLSTTPQGSVVADGTVSFRGGELFYFDRNFVIREGTVAMNFIDDRLDPLIDLQAEIREYLPRGPVSIFLIIEDDFLSQINPRLEAVPALSQAEIASILGGNIVEVASTTNAIDPLENARIAIDIAGDVISRIAVLNNFERSLKEILGVFDILTVRTQVLQNVIYDIINVSSANSTRSLAQYLNNTDLFLGTYLAERLFFQLEFGLRANEQAEYLEGAIDQLRLNATVSFEFQSPLGLLRWNLEPQFQDTFSVNSTIGLYWSFNY